MNKQENYEDERKWLVKKMGISVDELLSLASEKTEIEQGYFEVSDPATSVRVRIVNGEKAEITTKKGRGYRRRETRPEHKQIHLALGRELMENVHHKIFKTRLDLGSFELDVFHESLTGLTLVENEKSFVSPSDEVKLPDFIKDAVEVTDSLTNLHLARLATELRGLNIPAMPFITESLLCTIPCIGLVGGPGSGKSGIIEILKEEFTEIHFIPEVATIVIGQVGILPSRDPLHNRRFQKAIYEVGKIFGATSTQFAIAQGKKAVVLDRPKADGAIYFDGGIPEFEAVIGTTTTAEHSNLDMVICLEIPSKEIYEKIKKNNPSRTESYEEAVARGEKTKAIWQSICCGTDKFHLIGNEGGWGAKVDRVRQLIKSVIKS